MSKGATALKRRRQSIKARSKQIAVSCLVATCIYTLPISVVKIQETKDLHTELSKAQQRFDKVSNELAQANNRLKLLTDDTVIETVSPPLYEVPLSYELQAYTWYKCAEYGIVDYYELVLAVMWQESNYTFDLISSTQDYGLMQINSCNHKWLSELLGITDFLDAQQNIDAGTYLLSKLLIKYQDPSKALMAYNMGESGAVKLWNSEIYTSNYTRGVLDKYEMLKTTE